MWALMASGNRRKKRNAKIAKKKLPKRRLKKQVRIKKRQNKVSKKHYKKKYHKAKPKRKRKYVKKRQRHIAKYHRLTPAESRAKEWISWHESNDRWNIRSSAGCYGRYQLAPGYLHGDYSHANQSRTADHYVKDRYGGWLPAKRFWQAHHWY